VIDVASLKTPLLSLDPVHLDLIAVNQSLSESPHQFSVNLILNLLDRVVARFRLPQYRPYIAVPDAATK